LGGFFDFGGDADFDKRVTHYVFDAFFGGVFSAG
jgi:hypothetical protein